MSEGSSEKDHRIFYERRKDCPDPLTQERYALHSLSEETKRNIAQSGSWCADSAQAALESPLEEALVEEIKTHIQGCECCKKTHHDLVYGDAFITWFYPPLYG